MNRSVIQILVLMLGLLAIVTSVSAVQRVNLDDPASYQPIQAVDSARSELRIGDARYRLSPDVVIHRPDGRRGPLQVDRKSVV